MLVLFASEIAGCIGKNQYKTVVESMKNVLERNGFLAPPINNRKRLENLDLISTVEDIVNQGTMYSSQVVLEESLKVAVETALKKSVGVKVSAVDLVKDMVKEIHCTKGTVAETPAIDAYQEKVGHKILERNTKLYTKKIDWQTKLCGRVDGRTVDGKVIEVKNRQYRFFDRVPDYERVQIMSYMYLTDSAEADLVQVFRGESRTMSVPFDPNFWSECVKGLERFSADYHSRVTAGHEDLYL